MPQKRCLFCTTAPRGELAVSRWTVDPDDRERLTVELCAKHEQRVRRAGQRGYEHRGTFYKAGFW